MVKINKIDNKINQAFHDKKFNRSLKAVGKVAQKQVLPAVVSTAIPLASTALGAVATTYGGPMAGQVVQGMSQNLMEQYIPDKYQSKNKYGNMFGDALNQGIGAMSGDVDPYAMMNLRNQFANQVSKDLGISKSTSVLKPQGAQPMKPPKYNTMPYRQASNSLVGFDVFPTQMQYKQPVYNPENPYEDIMQQLYNKNYMATQSQTDKNAENDAIYKDANIINNADDMIIKTSPYQQTEGSVKGLLGAGLKPEIHIDINSHNNKSGKYKMGDGIKSRGRPKTSKSTSVLKPKTADEVQKIQNKKMAKYNKFMSARQGLNPDEEDLDLSVAPNPSLQQLLRHRKSKVKREGDEDLRALLKFLKNETGVKTPRELRKNRGHIFDN